VATVSTKQILRKEVMEMYKTFGKFNYDIYPVGKVYHIKEFIRLYEENQIAPTGGTIAEILVNGEMTNIILHNWSCYPDDNDYTQIYLAQLDDIEDKVEIVWCAKKIKYGRNK
jgi:hypothetical protein